MRTFTRLIAALCLCAASVFAQQNEGASLFDFHCRPCHGVDGAGKTKAGAMMKIPDLHSKEVQRFSNEELYQQIGNGAGHKQYPHAFLKKGFTDAQVKQVISYIRSLQAAH